MIILRKILTLLYSKVFFFFNIKSFIFYNQKNYENEQNSFFYSLGLDRTSGIKKLENIFGEYPFLKDPMNSEHQVFFSSLSQKKKINKILEIGTFDGKNAFLMSKLFQDSNIITVDLPEENKEFKKFYNRNNNADRDKFCRERDEILSKLSKIKFIKQNSVQLINDQNKFDLIWVDGAHGNPVVSIDILNAIRMINRDGYVLCDDIFISKLAKQDNMYFSNASHDLIEVLKENNLIEVIYIYKRLQKNYNYSKNRRKFIAVVKIK